MKVEIPLKISDTIQMVIVGRDIDEFDLYRLFEIIKLFNPRFRRLFR